MIDVELIPLTGRIIHIHQMVLYDGWMDYALELYGKPHVTTHTVRVSIWADPYAGGDLIWYTCSSVSFVVFGMYLHTDLRSGNY